MLDITRQKLTIGVVIAINTGVISMKIYIVIEPRDLEQDKIMGVFANYNDAHDFMLECANSILLTEQIIT
jgi:hypothetical protein